MARFCKAFGLVAVLMLSMAVATWAQADAEEVNKNRAPCATGQTRCHKNCVNLLTDANNCGSCKNKCSGSTSVCRNGACAAPAPASIAADAEEVNKNRAPCATGQTRCHKNCVNLLTDANNCGSCKNKCSGSTSVCRNGACAAPAPASIAADAEEVNKNRAPCATGQTRCHKNCVNLLTDANNCGSCKNKCSGSTSVCRNGACAAPAPAANN